MSLFQGCNFIVPVSITNQGAGAEANGSAASLVSTISDGNVYLLEETAAAPGFDVDFGFTNIRNIYGLVVRYRYLTAGLQPHGLYISLGADSFRAETSKDNTYNYMTILIPNGDDYITAGAATVSIIHYGGTRSTQHDLEVDYIAIIGLKSA